MDGRDQGGVRLERDSGVFVGTMKRWCQCPDDSEKPPGGLRGESAGSGWTERSR